MQYYKTAFALLQKPLSIFMQLSNKPIGVQYKFFHTNILLWFGIENPYAIKRTIQLSSM